MDSINSAEVFRKLPWMQWQIGERVVVRYRGEDGFLHDALGELVRAEPSRVTIQTRAGEVEVHASTMITGKRVPPPPAR